MWNLRILQANNCLKLVSRVDFTAASVTVSPGKVAWGDPRPEGA